MTLELVDHSEFIVKTSDRQYFNFTIHWILYSCLNQPRIYGCPYTNLVILVDLVKCPLPYAPKNQSWGLRGGLGNNKSFGTGEHQSVPNLRLFGNEDETRKTLLTTGMICQLVYVGLRNRFWGCCRYHLPSFLSNMHVFFCLNYLVVFKKTRFLSLCGMIWNLLTSDQYVFVHFCFLDGLAVVYFID